MIVFKSKKFFQIVMFIASLIVLVLAYLQYQEQKQIRETKFQEYRIARSIEHKKERELCGDPDKGFWHYHSCANKVDQVYYKDLKAKLDQLGF